MAQKISYWLLVTLILSLGFGQLLRFDLYGFTLYFHDIIILCLLCLLSLTCDWRSALKRNAWLQAKQGSSADERTDLIGIFGLKIFFSGLALGWFFALLHYPLTQLLFPSLYTLRLLAYLVLYFLLRQSKIKIAKSYFIVSALVCCLVGLIQYVLLPDMRVFQYLGWDDHLSRLTLPHFDPTFTAVMLGLALLSTPLTSWFVSLLLSIGILLTYSRSVWLSLMLTLLIFIKNKFIMLLAVSCMLLAIFALPQKFGEGTNLLRTYSIASRAQSDLGYIKEYSWDLLLGRGMNTLILDTQSSPVPSHATGPNNSYLYLLLTSGVLGLIGWGIFMFSLYQKSMFKPMLIFFFITSLFNNVMFYPFALLWVLLIEFTVPTSA